MSSIERTIELRFRHRVYFTKNVFGLGNTRLKEVLTGEGSLIPKVLVILDESLHHAQPALVTQIESWFKQHAEILRMVAPPVILEGGERVKKSYFHVSEIQSHIDRYGIDRHSYVIAVGGGALLDLVGLAAATAHRGVRHVRIPTTTLSQADSGVGVKNGMNAFGKKNFIGTFAVPWAVINEAVKVALIRDGVFFDAIERDAARLRPKAHRDGVLRVVCSRQNSDARFKAVRSAALIPCGSKRSR